jgi:nucleoside-diphosphate-sugar epimerase
VRSLLIFGLGYTALRIAAAVRGIGWEVHATGSAGNIRFDDANSVRIACAQASHILSSVPPLVDGDPVLDAYGNAIRSSGAWIGYLSSTGVYGDVGGAWVDESAPIRGRRESRNKADAEWLAMGARVFRLPGIYGPGRSALDRVTEGKAHRIDLPDQVFSRVHVDDVASGVIAGFNGPPGAYNLSDYLPCSQNRVIERACELLALPIPPLQSLAEAKLSPMALAFYSENRRVANGKAMRLLGWRPTFPTYVEGLGAVSATSMPSNATPLPIIASGVQ